MPYKDSAVKKAKHAEYSKTHYVQNRQKILKRKTERKKAIAKEFAEYKATLCCTKCGQDHPAALDFHHVKYHSDNKKIFKLVAAGCGWERIIEEVAKCVVLCANCHRIHHYEERLEIKNKRACKTEKK